MPLCFEHIQQQYGAVCCAVCLCVCLMSLVTSVVYLTLGN
jgi:hypothetical protein